MDVSFKDTHTRHGQQVTLVSLNRGVESLFFIILQIIEVASC